MKRYRPALAAVVLLAAVILIFLLISDFHKTDEPAPGQRNIRMEATFDFEHNQLEICIINQEDTDICFGQDYEIQVLRRHKWRLYQTEECFNSIAYELPSQDQRSLVIALSNPDTFTDGVYRIAKIVNVGAEKGVYYSNEITVSRTN